jgi:hypothetical protein
MSNVKTHSNEISTYDLIGVDSQHREQIKDRYDGLVDSITNLSIHRHIQTNKYGFIINVFINVILSKLPFT